MAQDLMHAADMMTPNETANVDYRDVRGTGASRDVSDYRSVFS